MNWEKTKCPKCGEEVSGTLERVLGISQIVPASECGFEYAGHTEMDWNSQEIVQRDGEDVLVCPSGHEWTSKRVEGG